MVHPVYGSARGSRRTGLASALAGAARTRRFEELFALTGVWPGMRILDVGCGPLGLRELAPELDVTGVDLVDRPDYPGRFVRADATRPLPFAAREFDLVYCSSVVEHVPKPLRPALAAELRRVGRGWFVQTPAFSFPLEPHALLPFAHWLPVELRRRYWRLGVAGEWEDVALLRRREMAALFGPPVAELLGPFVKSWISIRPVSRPRVGRRASGPGRAGARRGTRRGS